MNRKNLLKLAAYLETLPVDSRKFDMSAFVHAPGSWLNFRPSDVPERYAECGTVACAAGHGPLAGIKPKDREGWGEYVDRVFALSNDEFGWCFTGGWSAIDNTPHGAAARIRWMLDKGLPENFHTQLRGDAPLCYLT